VPIFGISQSVIDANWEKILEEGLLLYSPILPQSDQYTAFLKQSLATVAQAIQKSSLSNPLQFFMGKSHRGPDHDPFLASAILQVRPITAMYLAFPAGTAAS